MTHVQAKGKKWTLLNWFYHPNNLATNSYTNIIYNEEKPGL